MVRKWEDCASAEEEIGHEEGGDYGIIQAPPVPAAKSVSKYDADLNRIDKTRPQHCKGMSVLQHARLVKIPNTKLRRDIKLIK